MIDVRGIRKRYGDLEVLKGINLTIAKGEVVSSVGASGAGKTTLLQILGTLDRPDKGRLTINDQSIDGMSSRALADFRNRNIGFVFQFHHLLPEFNALENVCIPQYINGTSKPEAEARATELLELLGLQDRMTHKPRALSGGEQQRVAVARALANQPAVVLADEPSGNLDSQNARELHELFFNLRDRFQQTFVIVTHNETLANMADRKLVMKDGVMEGQEVA